MLIIILLAPKAFQAASQTEANETNSVTADLPDLPSEQHVLLVLTCQALAAICIVVLIVGGCCWLPYSLERRRALERLAQAPRDGSFGGRDFQQSHLDFHQQYVEEHHELIARRASNLLSSSGRSDRSGSVGWGWYVDKEASINEADLVSYFTESTRSSRSNSLASQMSKDNSLNSNKAGSGSVASIAAAAVALSTGRHPSQCEESPPRSKTSVNRNATLGSAPIATSTSQRSASEDTPLLR